MGHSDVSITINVYTHIYFDDVDEEVRRKEEFRKAQAEVEMKTAKAVSKMMIKVTWNHRLYAHVNNSEQT